VGSAENNDHDSEEAVDWDPRGQYEGPDVGFFVVDRESYLEISNSSFSSV